MTFEDYKRCLFEGRTVYREQMLFENKKHVIHTVNKNKIALNRDDDKRLVQKDNITTYARGYTKSPIRKTTHMALININEAYIMHKSLIIHTFYALKTKLV